MSVKYFIAVEIEAMVPMADLTAALQRGYDGGAAGDFQVLTTRAPSYMVVFERDTDDDSEYVSDRADSGLSIEKAAQQQLAAELTEGNAGSAAEPVIEILVDGQGQCFDFGVGAMSLMAEFTK